MPHVTILNLIHQAMDKTGADGLWNENGECGCGRADISPCDCMNTDCALAKSRVVQEGEAYEYAEAGDTVWRPMQFDGSKLCFI
jgi:hypothetical protein